MEAEGLHRAIADYIAGMTDRYATEEYQRLFDPTLGSDHRRDRHERDESPLEPGRLLIDGEWADARSGKTFATVNPADESEITQVAEAGADGRGRRRRGRDGRRSNPGPGGR